MKVQKQDNDSISGVEKLAQLLVFLPFAFSLEQ